MSPYHRDLHSFPTRRSSDLAASNAVQAPTLWPKKPNGTVINGWSTWLRRSMSKFIELSGSSSTRARSEEHTSELQSLRHLVCRLLLEKKKKKMSTRTNTEQK